MMTKAPKTALLEAMRVLRYLQGTKHIGLCFKPCPNYQEVIAYTDANFSTKRSQTGAVVKLGMNVVAWRSMKQTEVSMSSAESEVQALASTEVLADYIKTLRESLCLPTPMMELRCDNTAAIVLATGEGSWRTKSAANKVNAVKEKVESGRLKISYVGTKEQCADALTKFLRGGPDQSKAREHLSLVSMESCKTGRGAHAKASGVENSFSSTGEFGPRVCRVICPDSGELLSDLSGPGGFGPFSLARGKKRLCHRSKACYFAQSVAILALIEKHFACGPCEPAYRDCIRTGTKNTIMVLIYHKEKETDPDGDRQMQDGETVNWGATEDQEPQEDKKDWRMSRYDEIELRLRDDLKQKDVHAVDTTSIVTKSDPIPLKDIKADFWLSYHRVSIADTIQF